MMALLDANVDFRDAIILGMVRKADMIRVLGAYGWELRWRQEDPIPPCGAAESWTKLVDEDWAELLVVDRHADRVARIGEFVAGFAESEGLSPLRVVLLLLPGLPIDREVTPRPGPAPDPGG